MATDPWASSPWGNPTPQKMPKVDPWKSPQENLNRVTGAHGQAPKIDPFDFLDDLKGSTQDYANQVAPFQQKQADADALTEANRQTELTQAQAPWVMPDLSQVAPGFDMTKPLPSEQLWSEHGDEFFGPTDAGRFNGQYKNAFQGPSEGDRFFHDSRGALTGPGMGGQFASGVQDRYAEGTPGMSNNAQDAYSSFKNNRPDLAMDPGLGGFFDNAKRRATEDIDASMAARGAFGSSAATGQISEAMTDLEAKRALAEAQYGLDRANTIRGFEETGGNLARSSDISSRDASDNEREWMRGLGDTFFRQDENELDRVRVGADIADSIDDNNREDIALLGDMATASDNSKFRGMEGGIVAADKASGAANDRSDDFFDNSIAIGDRYSSIIGKSNGSMMENDQNLFLQQKAMELGISVEELNTKMKNDESFRNDLMTAFDVYMSTQNGKG